MSSIFVEKVSINMKINEFFLDIKQKSTLILSNNHYFYIFSYAHQYHLKLADHQIYAIVLNVTLVNL